jgi:sugar phosphate isomerase/epimerase
MPFGMLHDKYLDRFMVRGLNPEIGIDANALERFSLSQFKNIADKLSERALRITMHGPFMDLSPGSEDPAVAKLTRKRFEQMLALIPLFKPISVVCHAGYDWRRYGYHHEVWLEKSAAVWAWLGRRIQDEGSRLVLENVYERSPAELHVLYERLQSYPVGFCLDTGHQFAYSCTPIEQWVESMYPYLEQVHLHDNNGDKDNHLALGKGKIDFDLLFTLLKQLNSKQPPLITLEIRTENDLQSSLSFLQERWPW